MHSISEKDITQFNSLLLDRKLKPATMYDYYFQLEAFFDHENLSTDVLKRIRKLKIDCKERAKTKYFPLRVEHLKILNACTDLEDKLLLRVLLFEDIPINKIPKIRENAEHQLIFQKKSQHHKFHPETERAAKDWLTSEKWLRSRRRKDGKVFSFNGDRSIAEHIDSLEWQLKDYIDSLQEKLKKEYELKYALYASYVQKFGQSVHKDDLIMWLSEAVKS